ncbi:hypothetical protein ACQEUU_28165 [Nonomuraea sp. CA-218870]|uniref:RNA polymerase sigma factor n=1 Tax=Nonomuraea sp. CA-218870 TaxID=3239998 RepID=UPI003D94A293
MWRTLSNEAREAIGRLCEQHGRHLYDYCRTGLSASDAELAVAGALLSAHVHGERLGDRELTRPWLYALARCHRAAVAATRPASTGSWTRPEAPDLVPEALRALDAPHRELLDLSVRHQLASAEIAAIFDVEAIQVNTVIAEAADRIEEWIAAVRAARTRDGCPRLAVRVTDWAKAPGRRNRTRIARHIRSCQSCRSAPRDEVRAGVLLLGLPLAEIPDTLRDQPAWGDPLPSDPAAWRSDGFPAQASDLMEPPPALIALVPGPTTETRGRAWPAAGAAAAGQESGGGPPEPDSPARARRGPTAPPGTAEALLRAVHPTGERLVPTGTSGDSTSGETIPYGKRPGLPPIPPPQDGGPGPVPAPDIPARSAPPHWGAGGDVPPRPEPGDPPPARTPDGGEPDDRWTTGTAGDETPIRWTPGPRTPTPDPRGHDTHDRPDPGPRGHDTHDRTSTRTNGHDTHDRPDPGPRGHDSHDRSHTGRNTHHRSGPGADVRRADDRWTTGAVGDETPVRWVPGPRGRRTDDGGTEPRGHRTHDGGTEPRGHRTDDDRTDPRGHRTDDDRTGPYERGTPDGGTGPREGETDDRWITGTAGDETPVRWNPALPAGWIKVPAPRRSDDPPRPHAPLRTLDPGWRSGRTPVTQYGDKLVFSSPTGGGGETWDEFWRERPDEDDPEARLSLQWLVRAALIVGVVMLVAGLVWAGIQNREAPPAPDPGTGRATAGSAPAHSPDAEPGAPWTTRAPADPGTADTGTTRAPADPGTADTGTTRAPADPDAADGRVPAIARGDSPAPPVAAISPASVRLGERRTGTFRLTCTGECRVTSFSGSNGIAVAGNAFTVRAPATRPGCAGPPVTESGVITVHWTGTAPGGGESADGTLTMMVSWTVAADRGALIPDSDGGGYWSNCPRARE